MGDDPRPTQGDRADEEPAAACSRLQWVLLTPQHWDHSRNRPTATDARKRLKLLFKDRKKFFKSLRFFLALGMLFRIRRAIVIIIIIIIYSFI